MFGANFERDTTLAVEEIVKEIQDFEGLQALRLEGNTFGVEAAQAIAKALQTKSEFQVCFYSLCSYSSLYVLLNHALYSSFCSDVTGVICSLAVSALRSHLLW